MTLATLTISVFLPSQVPLPRALSSLRLSAQQLIVIKESSQLLLLIPFMVHLAAVLIVCVLFAHVQVSTRILCSCSPFLWLGIALLTTDNTCEEGNSEGNGDRCRIGRYVWRYMILYILLGVVLHANYYPWT